MSRTTAAPPPAGTADDGPLTEVRAAQTARGLRLQTGLRLALVVFLFAALTVLPPDQYPVGCLAVALAYPLVWGLTALWLSRMTPGRRSRRLWVPLALDIVALAAVTVLAGASDLTSWTAYVVTTAFAVLPILAATQLRPGVSLVLAVPTVGVYLLVSIATREANAEPWRSVVLRTAVLVILCVGSVALSRLQRSRVRDIARLADDRSRLLVELTTIQERERQRLAEHLHDGALQYVLAARMDLEDAREGDPVAAQRVEEALGLTARLLRSTVSELNPAVLDRAGLVRAVEELAARTRRPGLEVRVDAEGVPTEPATDGDRVVYGAVRELLTNVVKHAAASEVVIELRVEGGVLTAAVTDDGSGFDEATAQERAADGHMGLTSHRLRAEASGGRLAQEPGPTTGTRIVVSVPR